LRAGSCGALVLLRLLRMLTRTCVCVPSVRNSDTDSVMVKFGNDPDTQTVHEMVQEALDQGLEAAQMVTKDFLFPIKLEFEKGQCRLPQPADCDKWCPETPQRTYLLLTSWCVCTCSSLFPLPATLP